MAFEEEIDTNGKRDSRHTIEHIEVIDPSDIPYFAELGVIASMQPEHMNVDRFEDNVFFYKTRVY
ncbi:hypothetical protein ASG99_26475 [Bacillus sp. Soil768D1]|nr:hypothetical protein ASG99_26475 [Bacillus sp. Soil768D1]